jgi:hypothetical protein
MLHYLCCTAFIAALPIVAASATQPPLSVKEVMRRVAAYVDAYGARASIVVATEHYTQQARAVKKMPEKRQLVSDFAIVKVEGMRGWQGFRDVIEVDGTPLPDRDDRLVRLLRSAAAGYGEARRLLMESARFNIGPIERDFNVPTTTLFFFTRDSLDRFKFSAVTANAAGIWEIEFRETARPTIIRTPSGRSVASSGKLWVNAADGTVVRTRLEVEGFAMSSTMFNRSRGSGSVDVNYQRIPALDMWLPESMDEEFEIRTGEYRDGISGRALYSNYRQFTTSVRIK